MGDPCNGSTCYNLADGGHQCFCQNGTWGVGCKYNVCNWEEENNNCLDFPLDFCIKEDFCNGRGACIWDDTIATYHSGCDCDPGWDAGRRCGHINGRRTFCRSNPCGDNGDCRYILPDVYDPDSEEVEFDDYECICDGCEFQILFCCVG